MALQIMLHLTQNHSAHEQELSHDRSTMGRGLDPCGGVPLLKMPRAANQTFYCSAQIYQGHGVMGAPRAHEGISKPARPGRSLVALARDWKVGQSLGFEVPETISSATAGCLK